MSDSDNRFQGLDMRQDFVLGYCLPKGISGVIHKAAKAVGVRYLSTDVVEDLFVVPSVVVVADFSKLSDEELSLQYEGMKEIDLADPNFRWILLGKQALRPPKVLRERLLHPKSFDEQGLRPLILRQLAVKRRTERKAATYDRRLMRLLSSLKQLRTQKIVKTKDLCEDFNVNPRTIARDMQLLQNIGEMIEYDPRAKAYRYLLDDKWPGGR